MNVLKKCVHHAVIIFVLCVLIAPSVSCLAKIANEIVLCCENIRVDSNDCVDFSAMTDAEIEEYELLHGLLPMEGEASAKEMTTNLEVQQYLSNKYFSYSWGISPQTQREMADIYGVNPNSVRQQQDYVVLAAKALNFYSDGKQYVGCGPVALMSVLNFYAETVGYCALNKYSYNRVNDAQTVYNNRYERAYSVLEHMSSIGFGEEGTAVLPSAFLSGATETLKSYGLASSIADNSLLKVSRVDKTLLSDRVATVKDAIDNGRCVVWWTSEGIGSFSNHYMNIIGYQDWVGIDENNNSISKTFWLVQCNWGQTVHRVDSNIMESILMGLMIFEQNKPHLHINNSHIGIEDSYNGSRETRHVKTRDVSYENFVIATYLRATYIKHYTKDETPILNGRYIALSPNKQGCGVAYLEILVPFFIKRIDLDISWWRYKDRYTAEDGELKLQIYNTDTEQWITIYDFMTEAYPLSTALEKPTKISFSVDENAFVFRIYATYNNPTSTNNNGRIIIHDINVFG